MNDLHLSMAQSIHVGPDAEPPNSEDGRQTTTSGRSERLNGGSVLVFARGAQALLLVSQHRQLYGDELLWVIIGGMSAVPLLFITRSSASACSMRTGFTAASTRVNSCRCRIYDTEPDNFS